MSLTIKLTIEVDTGNEPYTAVLFDAQVTGNLIPMWEKAGIYSALYESSGKRAGDIGQTLWDGLRDMYARPEEYKQLNPPSEWWDYDGATKFLLNLTSAVTKYPKAVIKLS